MADNAPLNGVPKPEGASNSTRQELERALEQVVVKALVNLLFGQFESCLI